MERVAELKVVEKVAVAETKKVTEAGPCETLCDLEVLVDLPQFKEQCLNHKKVRLVCLMVVGVW